MGGIELDPAGHAQTRKSCRTHVLKRTASRHGEIERNPVRMPLRTDFSESVAPAELGRRGRMLGDLTPERGTRALPLLTSSDLADNLHYVKLRSSGARCRVPEDSPVVPGLVPGLSGYASAEPMVTDGAERLRCSGSRSKSALDPIWRHLRLCGWAWCCGTDVRPAWITRWEVRLRDHRRAADHLGCHLGHCPDRRHPEVDRPGCHRRGPYLPLRGPDRTRRPARSRRPGRPSSATVAAAPGARLRAA